MNRFFLMVLCLLVILTLVGCGSNSTNNQPMFEEDNLKDLSVTLEEAKEIGAMCLKRGEDLYALNILPGGRTNEKFGLDMYGFDFMYVDGVPRYYTYENQDPPVYTHLFNYSFATFGEVPMVTLRAGDRLVLFFRTADRDKTSPIRILRYEKIAPSFRMFSSTGVNFDSVGDKSYLSLYDFKTNETICLNSEEIRTMEVKDTQGNVYERYKVDNSVFWWNYAGLKYGETYIVSWDGANGAKQELEVVADSWQYGKNTTSKYKEKTLKLVSSNDYIEEYEFPNLPTGSYLIDYSSTRVIINVN